VDHLHEPAAYPDGSPTSGQTAVLDRPDVGPAAFRFDVAIVGLGYVGLPTALTFHAGGARVVGLDISRARLAAIHAGAVDLLETDRVRLERAMRDTEAFHLGDDMAVLADAAAVLVCVPTPVDDHLLPDLAALTAACQTVVQHTARGQVLMLTSTTYVGCTQDLLVKPLRARGLTVGEDVFVAFAPERIDPGNDRHEHREVPRVVGGVTRRCTERAVEALRGCAARLHPVRDAETAEMTKLYENTFRAVNISLANEFADLGRSLGLDIAEVIDAAATKPYGFMPFYPGPGIGGHCIPCDPHYLLWQLRASRLSAPIIETAMASVARRPRQVVRRAQEILGRAAILGRSGGAGPNPRVLVLGVTYKPGVSDVRESPALEIIERLAESDARVAYADDRVPSITVAGERFDRVERPGDTQWDLVIVHSVHPETDLSWLKDQRAVLDTTYRLAGVPWRELL
jgi:UDP-N-acetyl-D-glucosamine dehydrogenase